MVDSTAVATAATELGTVTASIITDLLVFAPFALGIGAFYIIWNYAKRKTALKR